MARKSTIGVWLIALALVPFRVTDAQQTKKVPRIGYLSALDPARESARTEAIRLAAMRELGYIEGQNIASEYRYAEGKGNRQPELASELVRLKVDLIVVAGTAVLTRAVKNATKTIPIVMVGGGVDPVEAGLVESLARPGGNVTGLTNLKPRTRPEISAREHVCSPEARLAISWRFVSSHWNAYPQQKRFQLSVRA